MGNLHVKQPMDLCFCEEWVMVDLGTGLHLVLCCVSKQMCAYLVVCYLVQGIFN
jgi:hypothetical protein